jgi:hypothetical protein
MTKKLFPYINKHTGDIQVLSKADGEQLNENWARAKMAKNEKGEKVFRFQIAAPIQDKNGKTRMGVAVVDISEVQTKEVSDGNGNTK